MAMIAWAFTGLAMTGTAAAEPPACPLDEDFSSWLPSGWMTDDWTQNATNNAGGMSPEALLVWSQISGNHAYLNSNPVDTTGAGSLTLEFKSYIVD
jgi:hypothetical protein